MNVSASPAVGTQSSPHGRPWGLLASLVLFLLLFEAMGPVYDAIVSVTGLEALRPQRYWLHSLLNFTYWALKFVVIVLAVKLTVIPVRDYLGWNRPRVSDVALGVGVVLAVCGLIVALVFLTGNGPDFVAEYRAAMANGMSPWWYVFRLWPAIFLAAFVEESFFRGFMWRGIEAYHGKVTALLITSILFAAMHHSYYIRDGAPHWPSVIEYLLTAFFFGWLRWRSGGTTAPMIAHAVENARVNFMDIVASAFVP